MNSKVRNKVLVIVISLIIVLFGLTIYRSSVFHIVKTDPSLSSVAEISPSLDIYFNKSLSASSLSLDDPQHITSSSQIEDKELIINFSNTLNLNETYTLTIAHIASTSGSIITNKRLTFTAKNIAVQDMSTEQQNKVIANQDKFSYSLAVINFVNFGQLTNQGITSDQLTTIETAIFNFSKTIKKQFNTVTLSPSSLTIVFHNPTSQTFNNSSATFTINADGTTYTVRSEYPDFGDDIYTRIYDTSGAVVFDSSQN